MNGVLGKYAGLSLTKHTKDFSFSLNFEHGNQDELKENTLGISFSKKLQKLSKLRMEKEKADPQLEKLFDQLQVIKKNERLAKLAKNTIEENKDMKNLIIELLKENQKLKTENKIFNKAN